MAPRGEPERTCVGCRASTQKRGLLRVVRSPQGEIRLDASGTAPGRGAYLHVDLECVALALRKGALTRSLRASLSPDEAARLKAEIEKETGR